MPQTVRVGTRASVLALTQTGHVADALTALGAGDHELVRVRTDGDRLTGSLATLGGTGVFVTALRDALLDGRCDVAVHSFKDLPTTPAPGLVVAAVPVRQDPRDALCAREGWTLATLPEGASVGTGSPRRAAQLLAARPDLRVVDIRGNVDTRLRRIEDDLDAVVLAAAGLARLDRLDAVTEALPPDVMTPAPAQGALAVEVRAEDAVAGTPLAAALAALDHRPTHLAVLAERALLNRLEAGCAAPVGAHARLGDDGVLTLSAVVLRTDGTASLHRSDALTLDGSATDDAARTALAAAGLGTRLAETLLADGAADLADLAAGGRA
ncbi:hydroxymethylbilane synthase [Cellulomonas triticagri]|uniref:Porphobilinogen deaminase n=1 Tax=Cellulomonas triticagri TaxID=2483352 RepID=A0A3M2IMV1_9CELL|nr:hydroxymethylbilane synthase [Cellulomonas triticagri]RMI03377.1 hydroxymethylbilane synthase [Cellulomonas triticagri]